MIAPAEHPFKVALAVLLVAGVVGVDASQGWLAASDGPAWACVARVVDPEPGRDDAFGAAVAWTRDGRILVGAPSDDDAAPEAGAVYELDPNGDVLAKHLPPEPVVQGRWGGAMVADLEGDRVLVGSRGAQDLVQPWRASLHLLSDFETLATSEGPADRAAADQRTHLALADGLAVVGVATTRPLPDGPGSGHLGQVQVFSSATGALLAVLEPPGAPESNGVITSEFGQAVATAAGQVFVADVNGDLPGRVEVYDLAAGDRPRHVATIGKPPGEVGQRFGRGLATDGTRLFAATSAQHGSVHAFDLASAAPLWVMRPADPNESAEFGMNLWLRGGLLLLSHGDLEAWGFNVGTPPHAVTALDAATGAQVYRWDPVEPLAATGFGWAVDADPAMRNLVVGAVREDTDAVAAGAVYVYRFGADGPAACAAPASEALLPCDAAEDRDSDGDGDGLTSAEEARLGSDPCHPDIDGDFLNDGVERHLGTDPNHLDSDADGLSDRQELIDWATDPTLPDSDGDLSLDGEEVSAGTDPNDPLSFPLPAAAGGAWPAAAALHPGRGMARATEVP